MHITRFSLKCREHDGGMGVWVSGGGGGGYLKFGGGGGLESKNWGSMREVPRADSLRDPRSPSSRNLTKTQ